MTKWPSSSTVLLGTASEKLAAVIPGPMALEIATVDILIEGELRIGRV
jgi:hypothetical protein